MQDSHNTGLGNGSSADTVDRTASAFQQSVGLDGDDAAVAAEDILTPGTGKPSSVRVDDERSARARSEAPPKGRS